MPHDTTLYFLPHHKLIAYQVARELLVAVVDAQIRNSDLRDQALRAARSACLNIAEANGRFSKADRRRVFAIARGEATEAAAAVEVAALSKLCTAKHSELAQQLSGRLIALLSGLMR